MLIFNCSIRSVKYFCNEKVIQQCKQTRNYFLDSLVKLRGMEEMFSFEKPNEIFSQTEGESKDDNDVPIKQKALPKHKKMVCE